MEQSASEFYLSGNYASKSGTFTPNANFVPNHREEKIQNPSLETTPIDNTSLLDKMLEAEYKNSDSVPCTTFYDEEYIPLKEKDKPHFSNIVDATKECVEVCAMLPSDFIEKVKPYHAKGDKIFERNEKWRKYDLRMSIVKKMGYMYYSHSFWTRLKLAFKYIIS